MKKIFKQTQILVLFLLIILGGTLRLWKYEYFPVAGETQDEVAWTILGSSLLQTGTPISWSYFKGYEVIETITFRENQFQLVKPALDHPPLFSLIPGFMQTITGHNWKEIPSIKLVRLPMVLLSICNLVLFAWWLQRVVRDSVHKWLSVAVAATAPSVVFLSRLVVSENLLITWMLVILLLQSTNLKGWKRWAWFAAHAALPLTKISGLAIAAGSIAWSYVHGKGRQWLWWSLGGTVIGVGLLLLYVSWYDLSLFIAIQTQQAERNTGLLTLFSSWWWSNTLVERVFADTWNQIGLLSLLVLSFLATTAKQAKNKTHSLVLFLFVAQFAFYLLSVGETTVHGWYRIVFWPLWAYAFGWLVNYAWQEKNHWWLSLSWLLLGAQIRLGLVFALGISFYQYQSVLAKIWLLFAGVSLGSVILFKKQKAKLQLVLGILLSIIVLLAHGATVLQIQHELFWKDALYLEQGIQP